MKKCKDCGKERGHDNPLISRCKSCSYKRSSNKKTTTQLKRTPIKTVGKKRAKRLKENGSEVKTYEKKLLISEKCVICGSPKGDFYIMSWCFAHILNKRDWPHLRNFINNLAFVCSIECHDEVDKQISGQNKKEIEKKILNGEEIKFKRKAYLD